MLHWPPVTVLQCYSLKCYIGPPATLLQFSVSQFAMLRWPLLHCYSFTVLHWPRYSVTVYNVTLTPVTVLQYYGDLWSESSFHDIIYLYVKAQTFRDIKTIATLSLLLSMNCCGGAVTWVVLLAWGLLCSCSHRNWVMLWNKCLCLPKYKGINPTPQHIRIVSYDLWKVLASWRIKTLWVELELL